MKPTTKVPSEAELVRAHQKKVLDFRSLGRIIDQRAAETLADYGRPPNATLN